MVIVAILRKMSLRRNCRDCSDHIEHLRNVLSDHLLIYRAIERQVADDARAAMRMHLSNSREHLRRAHALSAAGV